MEEQVTKTPLTQMDVASVVLLSTGGLLVVAGVLTSSTGRRMVKTAFKNVMSSELVQEAGRDLAHASIDAASERS